MMTCESCRFGNQTTNPVRDYVLLTDIPDMERATGDVVTLCDNCADYGRELLTRECTCGWADPSACEIEMHRDHVGR